MSLANTLAEATMTGSENSHNVLDLSGKGLMKMDNLPKKSSVTKLILNNNDITKIEKLENFPRLSWLSVTSNHLVRMNGVNYGKHLTAVNLSNNGIVSMEGLCWLVHLEYLDLSKNNIKRIENVSYCVKLKHMDLSENSISDISDLNSLVQLKALLLRGNAVTTLKRAQVNLPEQLETLSLVSNGISDLNEVSCLSGLKSLKHLSIAENPCVIMTPSMPEYDYRPFVFLFCPTLLSLDGFVVTENERIDAERLKRKEDISLFSVGHHLQLALFLNTVCPLPTAQRLNDDQKKFLDNFLEKKKEMERFSEKQNPSVINNTFSFRSGSQERPDGKLSATSESTYGPDFSEYSGNGGASCSGGEDDEHGLLRSESSFLPVYSPLKKSVESSNRDYSNYFNQSVTWNSQVTSVPDDEDFPIMTEEEANKLIHLAATIVQAHIRGFLVRQKFNFKNFKRKHDAACKIQALWKGYYFRHYSPDGVRFKNELRVQRLQKYVATLCLMMQKKEQCHEAEKQHLLEAVSLLYEQLTQLSMKVERQDMENKEKRIKLERNGAVTIQRYWRGYIARKQNGPRIKTSNVLEQLLNSHAELRNKVIYLESLLGNADKREADGYQDHSHRKFLEEDINEQECPMEKNLLPDEKREDLNDDQETTNIKDPKEPVRKDSEKAVLDDTMAELVGNDLNGETFVKRDDVEKGFDDQTTEEYEGKGFEMGVKNKHSQNDVVFLGEGYEGHGKISGNPEDHTVDLLQESSCNDAPENEVDNVLKEDSLMEPEPEREDNVGNEDNQDAGEKSLDEENHVDEDPKCEEVLDCKDEIGEEHRGGNGDYHKEASTVNSGETVEIKEDHGISKDIGEESTSIHEITNAPVEFPRSPLLGKKTSCFDVENIEITGEVVETSNETAKDSQVSVRETKASDLASSDELNQLNDECSADDKSKESCTDETTCAAKISDISPRLGKRASSLLSALKTEITNASLKNTTNEEALLSQPVSHTISGEQEISQTFENIDSNQNNEATLASHPDTHTSSGDEENTNTDKNFDSSNIFVDKNSKQTAVSQPDTHSFSNEEGNTNTEENVDSSSISVDKYNEETLLSQPASHTTSSDEENNEVVLKQ